MAIEIAAAYEEVADGARREEAWGRAHRETRRWFVAAAQAYQVGTLEPKELVDAVKAYFTARYSHLEAMRDHNTALARLSRVTGDPLLPDDGWEVQCEE
jgi:outer membrane protein TolC